jgi:formate hydrogenlyase subunit 3/multisubunit Na+/H+ antiporter MnhD subunit
MTVLWIATALVPMLLALLVVSPGQTRRFGLVLAPWGALPALVLALVASNGTGITVPWLLLGTRLGLDVTGQVFLLVTAGVWLAAGVFAGGYVDDDPERSRFWFFFLLTMSGNLGLIIALDVVTFYSTFALMTFAAYGLVVHDSTPAARRAGRVYLVMSIVGEMFILAGMLFTVWVADSIDLRVASGAVAVSDDRNLIVALLLIGFGVKVGALPLHMWLPLAHPVAPTPASAVLSGCMIKAGLLGWIRFLPLGEVSMSGMGGFVIGMGLLAAFFGVAAGLLQDDPKTLLAYSSISQMGLITVAIGIGFAGTEDWDLALAAVIVFVLHHSLAKGSLFLGVGVAGAASGVRWMRRTVLVGLSVAALAMAGAPLTSGALAKTALKDSIHTAESPFVDVLLPITSIATTLLMVRFILLVREQFISHDSPAPFRPWLWIPWIVLVLMIGIISWALPWYVDLEIADPTVVTLAKVWSGIWPVLVGLVLFGGAGHARRKLHAFPRIHIPAGDLIVVIEGVLRRMPRSLPVRTDSQRGWVTAVAMFQSERPLLIRIEVELARWRTVGIVLMSLILLYLYLLGLQ